MMGKFSRKWAFLMMLATLLAFAPVAKAQTMSGMGVATGGDTVSAIVPEAANLFNVIDILQDLNDAVVACAQQGAFVASADPADIDTAGCRLGVPPVVDFDDSGSDTFVDVELAFGQEVPGADTSPRGSNFVRYGGLDGEDGQCSLESGGLCPW